MPRRPIPPVLLTLAADQAGLVDVRQARAAGLTDGEVRGYVTRGIWLRIARAVYDTSNLPIRERSFSERRRRAAWAALLAFGPEAVAVGACALALHEIQGLPASIRPEAALPRAVNRVDRAAMRLRQFDDGMTTTRVGSRRLVTLDWALAQAVPELPRANALAVLDSALHRGAIGSQGLEVAHHMARGRRGVARTHELWALADARAESPLESFGRLDCVDEGVPPTVLQLPIEHPDGMSTLRGDMAWRRDSGRWLVAEMDGHEVHGEPSAVYADRYRQNLIVATGRVDVLRFTHRDLPGVGQVVRRMLGR